MCVVCVYECSLCGTHSLQLLVACAEPLPLAGDDGEQGVHLALRTWGLGLGLLHTVIYCTHTFILGVRVTTYIHTGGPGLGLLHTFIQGGQG